jgi:sortase A
VTGARVSPIRAVVRFLAAVMMVSGALLIADVAATLLWQEPLSWLLAQRQQGKLEDALAAPPQRVLDRHPLPGDAIARIQIPAIGVDEFVVEGTDRDNLRKGPGHYPSTPLPGARGTVAIAGHRTTYGAPFRRIDDLKGGERVALDMPGGRYLYSVERTRIVDPTELSVLRKVRHDRLVLSACHPLYSAAQRIVTFARYVRREPSRVRRRS